jgi:hypothetical protein
MDFASISPSLQTESRHSFPNLVITFTYIFSRYRTDVVENTLSNNLPYASIRSIGLGLGHRVVPVCVSVQIYKNINPYSVLVGPCHHGIARPQVADRGTASDKEGSCE